MNSSQSTQSLSGNRITFTSQTLPNGTINLGGSGHPGGGPTIISTSQLPNTTTIKTITSSASNVQHHGVPQQVQVQHHSVLQTAASAQQQHQQQQQHQGQGQQNSQHQQQQSVGGQQTQTLVIKSNHAVSLPAGLVSSAPGIVTMTKTINQGNQPLLNSMIPGNVVLGMRPPSAQTGGVQPKNVQGNNVLGRVVIGGQNMVNTTRPQNPGITYSALTQGSTPALILKTENGFQLLRVGTATSGPVTQTIGTNSTNPTQIRLQTVPAAVSRITGPPLALRKTIVRSSTSTTTTTTTQQQPQKTQQQQQQQIKATASKQIKQNSTSTANNIIVNSVASTNSHTSHVYSSTQPQISTNVAPISSVQQQQQTTQLHHQTQHLSTQPQITQIQTIPAQPAQQQQQHHQPQQHQQQQGSISNSRSSASTTQLSTTTTTTTSAPPQTTTAQGNTKEKCRKFLANLIDLSTREPTPVEKNVRNLIQELVNANVEPEEFCDRLERLLNASPQPCLIGFLKKSLPLLRHALYTKELIIEGIKPPPQHVVGIPTLHPQLPKIQAQIRPISQSQTTTIGQTQVRMISPSTGVSPRPIGHTTITKQQTSSIRIQGPVTTPRLVNATQIRGPLPTNMQGPSAPHLHQTPNIVQIRAPNSSPMTRPTTVQIRATKPRPTTTASITHVKVGQTQIKPIGTPTLATSSQPPMLAAISNSVPPPPTTPHLPTVSVSSAASILSTINSVAMNSSGYSGSSLPTPSLPTVQLPPGVVSSSSLISSISSSIPLIDTKIESKIPENRIEKPSTPAPLAVITKTPKSATSSGKSASKKKKEAHDKDKDDKSNSAANATNAAFFPQPSLSISSSMYGDDDINDVAAMGGVNLAEESQRILGCTENIGTQIRSCKDEVFLHLPALQARMRAKYLEMGLEEPTQEIAVLASHGIQERLKNIVENLTVIAEHRMDVVKTDSRYEITKDVRGQIKFLEELDKAEQKRQEELERELLLRAAKSRSKIEDPEQAKMKARAKEMQRAEMEELRTRDANLTALQAIGPRKKIKLESDATGSGLGPNASGVLGGIGNAPVTLRPRIKRINLRDMLLFMEQDREYCRSKMLYKLYLK